MLIGSTFSGMGGGTSKVVLFSLNPVLDAVTSATVLKDDESIVVGWDEPGLSLWVRSPDGALENVPLE